MESKASRTLRAQLDDGVPREEALQLGYALFEQGMGNFQSERYEEAIEQFEASLAINERHMVPGALGLCTNLNNLASAYDRVGRKDAAIYFYERAIGVLNATGEPQSRWDEQRRRARDHVLSKLARLAKAESAALPDDGADEALAQPVAGAMWEEGLRLYAAGQPEEALVLFAHVLTFNRKFRPDDAAVNATALNNIGAAHEKCGRVPEAISYFRAAADTLERSEVPGKEAKVAHVTARLRQLEQGAAASSPPQNTDGGASGTAAAGQPAATPAPDATAAADAAVPPAGGSPDPQPRATSPKEPENVSPGSGASSPPNVAPVPVGAVGLAGGSPSEPPPLSADREVAE